MRLVPICVACLMPLGLHAATYNLSLDQAVERSLQTHDQVNIAKSELEASEAKSLSATSNLLPTISAELTSTKYDQHGKVSPMAPRGTPLEKGIKEGWNHNMNITATQTLFTAGKVLRGHQMGKIGVEIGELRLGTVKDNIEFATKTLYYRTILAKHSYDIARESYDNAVKNERELKKRTKYGRASLADQVKMSADVAQREPTLKNAKTNYETTLYSLKEHLRLNRDDQLVLTSTFNEKQLPVIPSFEVEDVVKVNPKLNILKRSQKVSELQESNAYATLSPDVALFVQAARDRSGDGFDADHEEWKNSVNAGVGMKFSFGGKNIGDIKEAVANKYKAEYALHNEESSFRNDLQNALLEFKASFDIYASAVKSLKLAQETYKITFKQFKSGAVSQTYLNDRELQLTGAKNAKAQCLFNVYLQRAKIDYLISNGGYIEK